MGTSLYMTLSLGEHTANRGQTINKVQETNQTR